MGAEECGNGEGRKRELRSGGVFVLWWYLRTRRRIRS
ncbi:hypothetical protein NC652_017168 [Populus alba x Populus x berolinensis]|uniref:Uncharacterized protein n=1 Tax=Populus alba x Populus x berolinensis TaxID=444605 RepID=A0AAD6QPL5_9ROSI|nr:hypothetical protein NC651_016623 [Populus alba x Populus x berolinensis]KAJ6923767.1 hypothetical protein NC652_017168 [Populus alba x Populus x berolinensis]KAJ6994192.1 hypothetical protein NC653_017114 [Populus alba x Populus x berolinensis]